MKDNGGTPPDTVLCGRCATACDPDDNFCRHCGLALQPQFLPTLQEGARVPAVRQPALPAVVVKGATVIAAGALAEMLLRRVVGGVFGRRPRAERLPERKAPAGVEPRADGMPEGAAMVSETFLLRRVRIRR